jgi:hypothetical protein
MIRCPKCKGTNVVPIVRGYPTPEIEAMRERGEVVLGGCMIDPSQPQPTHHCRDCHEEFRVEEDS